MEHKEREELEHRILLLTNCITALYEHVDSEFRTRDVVLLKHDFNTEEMDQLDNFFVNIHLPGYKSGGMYSSMISNILHK